MRKLRWLSRNDVDIVRKRIETVAIEELRRRHWGALAEGVGAGGDPRVYILDIRGLFLATGVLRYTLAQHDSFVLYRGQRQDWVPQASLFRNVERTSEAVDRCRWLDDALDCIQPFFDPQGTADEREALAQHYGLPTRWLDVVDHVQTAAWFAYHHSSTPSQDAFVPDEAVGYISALACPRDVPRIARAYDLRRKPSTWLRPHIQQAWGIRAGKPEASAGRMAYLKLVTFVVPKPLLKIWSAYEAMPPSIFFPNLGEDRGLQYWMKSLEALEARGLWPAPWTASSK